jgi:hypothetical protein
MIAILTPNSPVSEYARSSYLAVFLPAAHDIFLATQGWYPNLCTSARASTFVISIITSIKLLLLPISIHSLAKNTNPTGAISSYNVQPRVNHSLLLKDESSSRGSSSLEPSCKYASQNFDFWYHEYMLLIASESSALLLLSMQHRSLLLSSSEAL